MNDLSVFCDESGDFGAYEYHSPFYIVAMVFHDQSTSISESINLLNTKIRDSGFPNYNIHTGPLIRREDEYYLSPLIERKRIFNTLYNFTRTTDITYHSIIVEKKQLAEEADLITRISNQLSSFLFENIEVFTQYDRVVVYYDNGQRELTSILVSVFNAILSNVEFKRIAPASYKLFQAADMICTLELLSIKAERKMLTKSELAFFGSAKSLYKAYLRAIHQKRFI